MVSVAMPKTNKNKQFTDAVRNQFKIAAEHTYASFNSLGELARSASLDPSGELLVVAVELLKKHGAKIPRSITRITNEYKKTGKMNYDQLSTFLAVSNLNLEADPRSSRRRYGRDRPC